MTSSDPWGESAMYPSATKFFDPDGMRTLARELDECGQALDAAGARLPEGLDAGALGASLIAITQTAVFGAAELVMRLRLAGEQLREEAGSYEATEEQNTETARQVGSELDDSAGPRGTAWW